MPSDEAVKAARYWMDTTVIGETATELSLADLLDRMMAQARFEEHELLCDWCAEEKERCSHGAELERLAGRGK